MILNTKKGKEIILEEPEYNIAAQYTWLSKKTGNGDHEKIYTYIDGKMTNFNKVVFCLDKNQYLLHKNGDCFNYLLDNILILTRSELSHHTGSKGRNKSSRYHGIHFLNSKKKWIVRVNKNEKAVSENCYDFEEEAAVVADYISVSKFKDKAKRNFPELKFEALEVKYLAIKAKYGFTKPERWAKVVQGCSRSMQKASKYVGVTFDKRRRKKWCARIKFNKNTIHIGNFEVEEDAARAYDEKAVELYGENAKINFCCL